jgi:beta-lactam-binding protein with PASTA domain/tRNA A-37 threonylcarbamoyl transferase component Bud32
MTSSPTTVGGRYELGELLGRGGMAEVRRAVDQRLGRSVAVKQLRADLAIDPTFQARFRREAQSAAGLNHPTIVAVYDTGEEIDPLSGVSIPYIVMELVEGPTLRDVLREGRKILPERALELTQGVLEALSYSHKAGIVHRDIKPANVMLTTPNGGVKVMDFGIARAVADTSATMTQTAAVIGTAQYLSPEQARGETVDARSDLYSTGCLLYELLAGRPPFVGDSPVSVAYQHVREAPVPPSQLDPELTPEIDAVVLKALAKDPDDRYQSAGEMKADIARLLSGEQTTAQRTTAVVPMAAGAMAAGAMAADAYDTPTHVAGPPTVLPPEEVEEGEYQEEEEPQKSRVGLAILITALIVLALGLGGWALYRVLNPPDTVAMVEVPSVLGYNEQQARDQLAANNLQVEVKKETGDEESKGTITAQEPVGGTEVAENSTVTITLNEGPKTGTIPDGLVGQDVGEVEKALDDLKFSNVNTVAAKSEDPDTQPGEVISISPKEGSTVPLDSKITVRYATGKSKVPNFEGLTRGAAIREARDAGFGEPQFSEKESSKPAGTVIAQSPGAGASVDRDTRIQLTLATAPPPPPPPTTEQPTPSPTTSTTQPTTTPTSASTSTSPSQGNQGPSGSPGNSNR